jgi:hypothetical protein
MADRKIPAPTPGPDTQAFWDAAGKGQLLVKKCTSCGKPHYYPRAICPFCFSDKTEWLPVKGTGTLYTHSTMRRTPTPYTIAYVTLDEGVTMMTNVVDADPDKLKIGQRMKVVFKASDGGPPVPCFTPA